MSSSETENKKIFVLDTSVIIHNPHSLYKFNGDDIVIPTWVVSELDNKKKASGLTGMNAREGSRILDSLNKKGSLKSGIDLPSGGKIYSWCSRIHFEELPFDLETTNDNRIIAVAHLIQKANPERRVVIVSKDINLRITATHCGLTAEDFKNDRSVEKIEQLYSGIASIEVKNTDILRILNQSRQVTIGQLQESSNVATDELQPNQCCYLMHNNQIASLALYKKQAGIFRLVPKPNQNRQPKNSEKKRNRIQPINYEQAFAYALLTDPEIVFVTLLGRAGTGKTLLAVYAGHEHIRTDPNLRLSIYRPRTEIDDEKMGTLPGDVSEKIEPWTIPILDNLRLFLDLEKMARTGDIVSYLLSQKIEFAPINYLLGRSLHNQFIVIDESQNLTPLQIKTILTRPGQNAKIVLTGDPGQIYNKFVDPVSNGLTYAVERFKGQELFGHITLQQSERSKLAELADKLL